MGSVLNIAWVPFFMTVFVTYFQMLTVSLITGCKKKVYNQMCLNFEVHKVSVHVKAFSRPGCGTVNKIHISSDM